MSREIYSYVTALGKSPEFFDFNRKHEAVTKWTPGLLNSNTGNDFEIHILHHFDDSVEIDPQGSIRDGFSTLLINAVDLLITKSSLGQLSLDASVIKTEFENNFSNTTFTFEGVITDSNNDVWPQKMIVESSQEETATLYLYPSHFETEYPNSNVEVVSIFEDNDDFGTVNLAGINVVINNLGFLPFADDFAKITSDNPCTKVEVGEYQWVNRKNLSEDRMVPFGLVCYGNPSTEAKEAAVRKFIEYNTDLDPNQLEIIFPTIFGSYGFTMVPYWDNKAIESVRTIYSPVVDPAAMATLLSGKLPAVDDAHIKTASETIPTMFQSLVCMAIPDKDELDKIVDFNHSVDRYILASPTSSDFTNMPTATKEFVKTLMEALEAAESHPIGVPAEGVTIEVVGNLAYATFHSNGLRWRVLTKSTFTSFGN